MSNLLANANLWNDGSIAPPGCWNGTSYFASVTAGGYTEIDLTYTGAVGSSDTIDFKLDATGSIGSNLQVNLHIAGVLVQSADSTPTQATYSWPVPSGSTAVKLQILLDEPILASTLTVTPISTTAITLITFNPQVIMSTPPPVVLACTELGRTTRQYVSGYTLSRTAVTRVRRTAKRCVVANFNGALDPGRAIVSVDWETTAPWSIVMSNPRIESTKQRETMVDVFFNFAGWGGLKATVTLDNGEIYNAEFSFTVLDNPLYPSAVYPTGNGPFKVSATA